MLNIGIYAAPAERKKIKSSVNQYLTEINVKAHISYVTSRNDILKILDFTPKYNIIIIREEKGLTYLKKISVNYGKKNMKLTYGSIEEPLNSKKLDEIIFSSDGYFCPYGIYQINNNKSFRLVLHEDIEYFHWNGKKTILHLVNNETEEIPETIKKIKESIMETYFVECTKGHIINLFNIKKIDKVNNEIILKSGATIPVSRKNFNHVILMLIKAVYGLMN